MRIITGSAKGAKIATLEGTDTRPTTDMIKEVIFSMIQFYIEGKNVLDLFGGTGQLALECLSRGANSATITDSSREAIDIIIENAKHTKLYDKCKISKIDYMQFLKNYKGDTVFDLVFLDPPYETDMIYNTLMILDDKVINKNSLVICESPYVPVKYHKGISKSEKQELDNGLLIKNLFKDDEYLIKKYSIMSTKTHGSTRISILKLNEEAQS